MLKSIFEAFKKRAIFKLTYKELSRLSDRELSDLGLHRSMLSSTVYETVYGKKHG